ncbi:MAG: adenylyl-sulfate kinase, partial [Caulobacterales bacterium]|nr:adenylyl-sulfate kinase [Caulobacterales bacterium]
DLVDYNQTVFDDIVDDFYAFADELATDLEIQPIPMSALAGVNITDRSNETDWYEGPSLMEYLETVPVGDRRLNASFRMPVQWVNRPNLDFRGFSGAIVSGEVAPGDPILAAGSGKRSTVARIVTADGDLDRAHAGDAVTLVLEDEIDVSRGDVLVAPSARPDVSSQFAANVIWMDEEALIPGRPYLIKTGATTVPATVTLLKHKIDVNTLEQRPGRTLELNEIGHCNFDTSRPIAFDPYADNRDTGGFIIIDRFTNQTVGAGMIEFSLRRASNIHWQELQVDKAQRAAMKEQTPAVLWFTGLSGAGKSTVATLVERKLATMTRHTYVLDGDNIRHGLNRDLGFTDADRVENIRRIGEVARLFVDAGVIVLCSFISPFRAERRLVREMLEEGEFIEVFVDAPLELCIERDPKGLYKKAQAGEIKNFTGFDSPYEPPESPELVLNTADHTPDELADQVVEFLRERGLVKD